MRDVDPIRTPNGGIPLWAMLDLWMAVGLEKDTSVFEAYVEANGKATTWSRLLGVVRGPETPCAEPTGLEDWCVLHEGHLGPHYGADDVGTPNDLLARVLRRSTDA